MRIDASCVDFTTGVGVAGVQLTCTVKVAPRIVRVIAGGPSLDHDDDGEGHSQIVVVEREAVVLPSLSATADAQGRAHFDVGVASIYARLIRQHEKDEDFADVVALVRIRGRVDGLDRESPFVLMTSSHDSPTGDVDLDRLVLIDFANSIVGHTTDQSCRLWFQLHGTRRAGHRYECELQPVSPGIPGQQTRPVGFREDRARSALLELSGLAPGAAYRYRFFGFRLRRDADESTHPDAPEPARRPQR
jgi:hypothetical protein